MDSGSKYWDDFWIGPTPISPVITSTPATDVNIGDLYSYDVEAAGTPAPTFSLITFPAGMTIDVNTGLIQWTPADIGDVNVTVLATNTGGSDSQSFTITVAAVPPVITSSAVTDVTIGDLYSYDVQATGMPAPVYLLVAAPAGMVIDTNTGLIQWISDIIGDVNVSVQASNPGGSDTQNFTIMVHGSVPSITSIAMTHAAIGQLYSYDVNAAGVPAPIYSLITAPNDMTIDTNTGLIQWMPEIAGDFNVTILADNAAGSDTEDFILNVTIPPLIDYLNLYSVPTGLNLVTDDLICDFNLAGTATTAAVSCFKNDSPVTNLYMPMEGNAENALYDYSDPNNPIEMTAYGNPKWYSDAHDGNGAYKFNYSDDDYIDITGSMPSDSNSYTKAAWILLTSDANSGATNDIISGDGHAFWVPVYRYVDLRMTAGHIDYSDPNNPVWQIIADSNQLELNRWYFVAVTYDANSQTMSLYKDAQMVDSAGPIPPCSGDGTTHIAAYPWPDEPDLSDMMIGEARIYNYAFSQQQIQRLYDSNNTIFSNETEIGDLWYYWLTPFSTIEAGLPEKSNSLTIAAVPPVITSAPIIDANAGQLYSYDVEATGIPAPTFSLITSPAGMTIDVNTGLIQWTPLDIGSTNVTVQASNIGGSDSQSFTITVAAVPPVIISPAVTDVNIGDIYSYDVEATGMPVPLYSLIESPPGMTINISTGLIQWTPSDIGSVDVTVQVINAGGIVFQSFRSCGSTSHNLRCHHRLQYRQPLYLRR
jgi:hypothetical protein